MDQPITHIPALTKEEQANKQAQALSQAKWGDYSYEHQVETNTASSDSSLINTNDLKVTADDVVHNAWTNWENNLFIQTTPQIEYVSPPQYQNSAEALGSIKNASTQIKVPEVAELQKIVELEEKQIEIDEVNILETLEAKTEFSSGSLDFTVSNELHTPISEPESTFGTEPVLPVEHQIEKPVNLKTETTYHENVDFKFFFDTTGGWAKESMLNASGFILKHTFNKKSWGEAKDAIWDTLIFKNILGLGKKKELSPEEKENQQKQSTNKKAFFNALRDGMRGLIGTEQKRALKQRIEALNKALKRGNLSYEGSMDQNGQVRIDLLAASEKANSEKTEEQLKAEKRQKLMMATPKAKKGPGITMSMDKSHNFNNAAKLAG
jgi:hypothetical protein